ncbi:MAG: collagen-like triple helix repeat-containing protein [Candidatus Dependentiae bacterium]
MFYIHFKMFIRLFILIISLQPFLQADDNTCGEQDQLTFQHILDDSGQETFYIPRTTISKIVCICQSLCVKNILRSTRLITPQLIATLINSCVTTANSATFSELNTIDLIGIDAQITNLSVDSINGNNFFGGIPGATGITGITGNTGPAGQGATGAQGAQGPTGVFVQDNLFQVNKTTLQQFTTPATTINFNNIDFNNNWTLTNTTFICPTTGLYRVSYSLTAISGITTGYFLVQVTVNNIAILPQSQVAATIESTDPKTASYSFLAFFNQGDVLRLSANDFLNNGGLITGLPVVATLSAVKL